MGCLKSRYIQFNAQIFGHAISIFVDLDQRIKNMISLFSLIVLSSSDLHRIPTCGSRSKPPNDLARQVFQKS